MSKKSPVEADIIYEGERVRGPDMYMELGGPKVEYKAELVQIRSKDEVKDGVTIVGKDIPEFDEGSRNPFGILMEIYGKEVDKDLAPVVERRIHDFLNYIHGFMHLNQRYDIWCRINKDVVKKGVNLKNIGESLIDLFKKEYTFIEKIHFTFITDKKKVKEHYDTALKIYNERDKRIRGMKDDDVDDFYGCILCQSFAPNHVCAISPQRIALCGAISWLDARAAAKIDPDGPIFVVPKGQTIDEEKGEYSGVNEMVKERSNGTNDRFYMYSMFELPHTSCGCFEAIAFYIPEVDGIGVVDRHFKDAVVNGLKFSTMATQTGGGEQTEGFLGFGTQWMHSPKFLSAEGGWERIVWMPEILKEKMKESIPSELFEKIPTEKDVKDIPELQKFVKDKGHPIMGKEKAKEEPPEEKVEKPVEAPIGTEPVMTAPTMTLPAGGGIRIILKNARIYADKVIIKKADKR